MKKTYTMQIFPAGVDGARKYTSTIVLSLDLPNRSIREWGKKELASDTWMSRLYFVVPLGLQFTTAN